MSDLNLNFDSGVKNISMTNDNNDNLGFNKDNIPDYFYLIGTTLFLIKSLIHFYDKIQNEKEVTRRSVLISQYDSIGYF